MTVTETVVVRASPQACYDLVRSVDVHVQTAWRIGGAAVEGRVSGLAGLGARTTWRARFFGLPFRLTTEVTRAEPGVAFSERLVAGRPRAFGHDVRFDVVEDGCRLTDRFTVVLPFGPLGRLADALYLRRRMRGLARARLEDLRAIAEGGTPRTAEPSGEGPKGEIRRPTRGDA